MRKDRTIMKTKRKGKRKVWIMILVIIAAGLAAAMLKFEPGRREAMNLIIGEPDFKNLKDGTYVGEYKGTKDSLRDAKVRVTVESGAVTEIDVTGGALSGDKQTSEVRKGESISDLLGRVVSSQSLHVDVISGATISSKVHLKAVENALEQAEK